MKHLARSKVLRQNLDEYLASTYISILSGSFFFGSPETEPCRGSLTEKQVEVELTYDFEMATTEVTQAVWQAVGFPNPSFPTQAPDLPVNYVNWYDSLEFCNRLSEYAGLELCYDLSSCSGIPGKGCLDEMDEYNDCRRDAASFLCDGKVRQYADMYECTGYRLPTSPEWEYAARAGTTTATYNGDVPNIDNGCTEIEVLNTIAWYCFNSGYALHPVAQKQPNAWGLYDMLGNVQEWSDNFYTGFGLETDEGNTGPLVNPMGAPEDSEYYRRSSRGRYYASDSCWIRSAWKSAGSPDRRAHFDGLRPVRTLPSD
jgi:formylglycine-generating enzyme required for sulfatase activity